MKKIVFILGILLGTGVLILLSFSRETTHEPANTVDVDFSEGEKIYRFNDETKSFEKTDFLSLERESSDFYLHQISPIDGIYYTSEDNTPLVFERTGGKTTVTFGTGLFICTIQSGLESYEFRLPDLTIVPKGRGTFLINTQKKQVETFSFDAFLETTLVAPSKRSPVTTFTLFPSLLFTHDPKNTQGLGGADLLRISLIDSLRYVDMKTPEDRKILFARNTRKKDDTFFLEAQKDITKRIHSFLKLHTSLMEASMGNISETSFFDTSSALLINGSKKEVLLKNTLIEHITDSLRNPQNKGQWEVISAILWEMQELWPTVYSDGLTLLRQYYYVALFSRFIDKNSSAQFSWQEFPFLSEAEKKLTTLPRPRQGDSYINLSNLFSVYYFLGKSQDELNVSFEKNLQKVLTSKVLTKDEFLPFVFFITQYLSTGPFIPSEHTLLIISHLFQITDDYYENNKADKEKLATITSTTFYNYTKIFTKMHSIFLQTFIDTTPEGFLLKEEYHEEESANFEPSFTETFVRIIKKAKSDTESKKDILYSGGSFQWNTGITDSYTLLRSTLGEFDILLSMFTNYAKYLNDFHLNESNKSARGILVTKKEEMSLQSLETYLRKFNSLDISSLQVINNFGKDSFYDLQVVILGNTFSFKLWEQNHTIADISYLDTFWKKYTFPNITISLDQKEKQLQELMSSTEDPVLQYKYDFKNFFETTFLKGDTSIPVSVSESPESSPSSATPEIQLFIQKELLQKDFKNIADFLTISFKNVDVSIKNGERVIKLSGIQKTFAGENDSYMTEVQSDYIFNRHSFSKLTLRVKKEGERGWYEWNGVSINILPARISLLFLPESLKDLGVYLDTIRASYKNEQSITIDLPGKRVLLDNVPFTPNFVTP